MVTSDPTALVVEAPAIAVHEAARGVRDQLAEGSDPVAQGHTGITAAAPTDVGAEMGGA
jgi:hypothetical protein